MKTNILKIFMSLVLVANLFCMPVEAAVQDTWNVHYYSSAPSGVSVQTDYLIMTFYGGGYRAKATSLTGSYNRYISIQGYNGTVIDPSYSYHYIDITAAGEVTNAFYTNYIYNYPESVSEFEVYAHGQTSCVSNGWICINDPNVYNQ